MAVSVDRVNTWAQAISETEEEKCTNAIRAVSDALKDRFGDNVRIIHQGSHRNRTNIRADSDVDIAVVYQHVYFSDVNAMSEADRQRYWQNLGGASYSFAQFKDDVHKELDKKYVTSRKNKCIRIEGNSYRVSADVVPAFVSKRFTSYGTVAHEGIGFLTDQGNDLIHSYPEQHYSSGVRRNDKVSHFKAAVRVLKHARNEMIEKGIIAKDSMPSFFLECLVWNAPDYCFAGATYHADARSITASIYSQMKKMEEAYKLTEVSELKWLFGHAGRTPQQAESFMINAFTYLGES